MTDLLLLFLAAFGAASLLPFYSEPFLVGLVLVDEERAWLFWLVASVGNTLGAWLNHWIGSQFRRLRRKRWFPISRRQFSIAARWYRRFGLWSLAFAWAPVGGDALTLIAGVFRVPMWIFLPVVFAGKAARYAFVVAVTLGIWG